MRWVVPVVLCLAGCNYVFGLDPPTDAVPDGGLPAAEWLAVDGGDSHTCGIKADHTLWCWGRNDDGQLGLGDNEGNPVKEATMPTQVGSDASWVDIAAGGQETCARKDDDTLWCWGRMYELQPQMPIVWEPTKIAGAWKTVAVGSRSVCAIDDADALWCWGANTSGQLGNGDPSVSSVTPVAVIGGGQWRAVAVGYHTACGLHTDGSLWCWGDNNYGTVGVPLPSNAPTTATPVPVGNDTWTALALGGFSACGIRDDKAMLCWGDNRRGQLGDQTTTGHVAPAPVDLNLITDWTGVTQGNDFTCGLRSTGELLCWGDNLRGQLGSDPSADFQSIPKPVGGMWRSTSSGTTHACAIDDAGHLQCVGNAGDGALGDGIGSRLSPSYVGDFAEVSAGYTSTCALDGAGRISCWGYGEGYFGVFGDGTYAARQVPVAIPGTWTKISVGEHTVCALDTQSQLQCWGRGEYGTGTGTFDNSATPKVVTSVSGVVEIAVWDHVCVTTSGNNLDCWGRNNNCQAGQTCDGATPATYPNAPFAAGVGAGVPWLFVASGPQISAAIDTNHNLYTFGTASYGLRGDPSAMTSPFPGMVGITADSVDIGALHACAVGLDGTGWCWGNNEYGQLGDRTTSSRNVPTKVPGSWKVIDAGYIHSCGVKTDGTLWCWGDNARGQLGTGTTLRASEPMQVGTDATWTTVKAGSFHTCGIKSDGVFCWGSNNAAAVGDGTAWRTSYVVVGG